MSCDHSDYDFRITPEAYSDSKVRRFIIVAYCQHCQEPARWLGAEVGDGLNQPMTSPDRCVLSLPFAADMSAARGAMQ